MSKTMRAHQVFLEYVEAGPGQPVTVESVESDTFSSVVGAVTQGERAVFAAPDPPCIVDSQYNARCQQLFKALHDFIRGVPKPVDG